MLSSGTRRRCAPSGGSVTSPRTSSATTSARCRAWYAPSSGVVSEAAGVNDVALERYQDLEPAAIVDLVARNLWPSGLASGFGGGIALTDGTIHHQDIRRAVGLPSSMPAHRLVPVLNFALAHRPCRRSRTRRVAAHRYGRRLDERRWTRSDRGRRGCADGDRGSTAGARRTQRARAANAEGARRVVTSAAQPG